MELLTEEILQLPFKKFSKQTDTVLQMAFPKPDSTPGSATPELFGESEEEKEKREEKLARRYRSKGFDAPVIRECARCKVRETPMWRSGPQGKGTLCNACGVRWSLAKHSRRPPTREYRRRGYIPTVNEFASTDLPTEAGGRMLRKRPSDDEERTLSKKKGRLFKEEGEEEEDDEEDSGGAEDSGSDFDGSKRTRRAKPKPKQGEREEGRDVTKRSAIVGSVSGKVEDGKKDSDNDGLFDKSSMFKEGKYYCRYCEKTWPIETFRNSQQFGAHCSNCSRKKKPTVGPASVSSRRKDKDFIQRKVMERKAHNARRRNHMLANKDGGGVTATAVATTNPENQSDLHLEDQNNVQDNKRRRIDSTVTAGKRQKGADGDGIVIKREEASGDEQERGGKQNRKDVQGAQGTTIKPRDCRITSMELDDTKHEVGRPSDAEQLVCGESLDAEEGAGGTKFNGDEKHQSADDGGTSEDGKGGGTRVNGEHRRTGRRRGVNTVASNRKGKEKMPVQVEKEGKLDDFDVGTSVPEAEAYYEDQLEKMVEDDDEDFDDDGFDLRFIERLGHNAADFLTIVEEERQQRKIDRTINLLQRGTIVLRNEVRMKEELHKKEVKAMKLKLLNEIHDMKKEFEYSLEVIRARFAAQLKASDEEERNCLDAFAKQIEQVAEIIQNERDQISTHATSQRSHNQLMSQLEQVTRLFSHGCDASLDAIRREGGETGRDCMALMDVADKEFHANMLATEAKLRDLLRKSKGSFSESIVDLRERIGGVENRAKELGTV